jgi:Asp-tRNA(Asn)/Glu-tRNA(Gln) amidotransferase A subunit family amidase
MALSFEDYRRHDALGLAALIRKKEVSAAEVAEAAIARAEAVNPKINAIVEPLYDRARTAASGPLTGPFAGVPWAVKDLNHPIKGVRMTGGSCAFKDFVSDHDGESVRRWTAAGLNIIATSTSPEFGLTTTTESKLHGQTRNPWNLERTAGGSSGGSAALVAAGVLPAAHATDGGGSIRVPASCCGLVGLKVSRGRTPVGDGKTEGWNGLGVSHAVTRSVRDSAALLDSTHGPELGSRYVAPPPEGTFLGAASRLPGTLRIAVQRKTFSGVPIKPDCLDAVDAAAKLCESLGHSVEEAQPDLDGEALGQAMGRIVMIHSALAMDARADALGRPLSEDDMEAVTWTMVQIGRTVTATELVQADNLFMTAAIQMAKFQETYDVVLSPTLAQPPALLGIVSLDQSLQDYGAAIGAFSPLTAIHNQTGQPSISLPLHWSAEGLPIGVQFAGRLGAEETLLSLAAQLEQAQPWFDRVAPL